MTRAKALDILDRSGILVEAARMAPWGRDALDPLVDKAHSAIQEAVPTLQPSEARHWAEQALRSILGPVVGPPG